MTLENDPVHEIHEVLAVVASETDRFQDMPPHGDETARVIVKSWIETPTDTHVNETGEEDCERRFICTEPLEPTLILPTCDIARSNCEIVPLPHMSNKLCHCCGWVGEITIHPTDDIPTGTVNAMLDTLCETWILHPSLDAY